ncbi:hypothetical protein SAMD00019534_009260, partial [Acytostelium subglobosum LB1]|uniref:hypothetical protein n=1 Tax=Acytostelium subglobosum LB1 TaxID=1410327 RepID=UPI000644F359
MFNRSLSIVGLLVNKSMLKTLTQEFKGYLFIRDRIKHIIDTNESTDKKLVLLSETLANQSQLPEKLQTFLKTNKIEVVDHKVDLNYNNFTYEEVMRSVLPENLPIPHAFERIGHIAHLNLKAELLPYKSVIGQIILDKKRPQIRTVLNKVGKIDTVFRTFNYELLAGENDLEAEIKENDCLFRFNFAEVYWNSRLQYEHTNLIKKFRQSDVIMDMFAGVGPFAVPAAKLSKCTVYANDLNPSSVKYMRENAARNKATTLVEIANMDARDFVRDLVSRNPPIPFNNVIMNLPSTSIEFLDVFRDVFLKPNQPAPIPPPTIHCYCFISDKDDLVAATKRAVEAVIQHPLPADTECIEVRDVSPNKRMMRISFKMPTISPVVATDATAVAQSAIDQSNTLKRKESVLEEDSSSATSSSSTSTSTTSTTSSEVDDNSVHKKTKTQ